MGDYWFSQTSLWQGRCNGLSTKFKIWYFSYTCSCHALCASRNNGPCYKEVQLHCSSLGEKDDMLTNWLPVNNKLESVPKSFGYGSSIIQLWCVETRSIPWLLALPSQYQPLCMLRFQLPVTCQCVVQKIYIKYKYVFMFPLKIQHINWSELLLCTMEAVSCSNLFIMKATFASQQLLNWQVAVSML